MILALAALFVASCDVVCNFVIIIKMTKKFDSFVIFALLIAADSFVVDSLHCKSIHDIDAEVLY